MQLRINNLGAVKEAEIDISKKLNVFCGPNGTGKTYVAYALYGALKPKFHIGFNDELIDELIKNKNITIDINFESVNNYREDLISSFRENLDSLFGVSDDFVEQNFKDTKLSFIENNETLNNLIIASEFEISKNYGKVDIEISKQKNSSKLSIKILDEPISTADIKGLKMVFFSDLIDVLAKCPISSVFILPVERNSIYTFSKELSIRKQEAVDYFHAATSKGGSENENLLNILLKKTKRYPLPIRDGLIIADDLSEIKKNKSDFFDFAEEIEQELLAGKLEIDNDGEIKFKPKKSPKKALPIHMTASIIKSLSSLVVYLKHLAKPNDLIIIDEPEINLHPDNQITLTRLFARLINKGFRFLISTHSDYIVREFNNLVMLSNGDYMVEEKAEELGYKAYEFINKEDIDVHYFNYPNRQRGNKQVSVEKLTIEDTGFEVPSIDKIIEDQNNIAAELYYQLKYSDNE
ncbi:AAA family ATPase [Capnocytophaga canimorsus]|uniref:AAA family ATPase n=1 Tax=Capnocytophaga canimorsus TaxID=28188 RepID=UPI0037D4DEDF